MTAIFQDGSFMLSLNVKNVDNISIYTVVNLLGTSNLDID